MAQNYGPELGQPPLAGALSSAIMSSALRCVFPTPHPRVRSKIGVQIPIPRLATEPSPPTQRKVGAGLVPALVPSNQRKVGAGLVPALCLSKQRQALCLPCASPNSRPCGREGSQALCLPCALQTVEGRGRPCACPVPSKQRKVGAGLVPALCPPNSVRLGAGLVPALCLSKQR